MAHRSRNTRWLDNPARRVGRDRMLYIMRATIGENHPHYRDYKERVEAGRVETGGADQRPKSRPRSPLIG